MKKYAVIIVLALVVWNWGVYAFSIGISDIETIKYQLAARYSARTSFMIVVGLLLWMGIAGLVNIYRNEKTVSIFITILFAFAVNHLIHFGFLALNFRANGMSLIQPRNALGTLAYLLLSFAPLYLWSRRDLTKMLYLQIYSFLLIITTVFFVTYLGRLDGHVEMSSPMVFYKICLIIMIGLVALNAFRIYKELRQPFQ